MGRAAVPSMIREQRLNQWVEKNEVSMDSRDLSTARDQSADLSERQAVANDG